MVLLDQKQHAKTCRIYTVTTFEMVSSPHSSARYKQRKETKNIVEFVYCGEGGSIFRTWDCLATGNQKIKMEKFIGTYKRSSFIQGVFGRAMKEYGNSEEAVAMKYQAFLSRRKFNLICKNQSCVTQNTKCAGANISLPCIVSDERLTSL